MTININDILEKVDKIPQNFHIAVKVSKMLDDFNVDINELSKTISMDQSLTIQLIKLCNSAEYGFSKRIVTVSDAVSKLGFKVLKGIVFALVSKSSLSQEIQGYDLEKGALWRNSITCAVYARYLAELSGYKDPELAFTAGLLRDIGKLMIHEYVRAEYDNIINLATKTSITFSAAEEKILGYNHSQIGTEIANKWNFPPVLVEAIRYHHDPEKAKNENAENIDLINLVHVADSITIMMGAGIGNDGMMYSCSPESIGALGIDVSSSGIEVLIADMSDLNSEIELLMSSMK